MNTPTDPGVPPVPHPAGDLAVWAGTWVGTGRGAYPTIEPFTYREEIVLEPSAKGFLRYESRTWAETGPQPAGTPLHTEAGYWRPVGDRGVELVIAIPTGHVELDVGSIVPMPDGTSRLEAASTAVCTSPTAKPVDALVRRYELDPDRAVLRYVIDMAAVGVPMTRHLEAELTRAARPAGSR